MSIAQHDVTAIELDVTQEYGSSGHWSGVCHKLTSRPIRPACHWVWRVNSCAGYAPADDFAALIFLAASSKKDFISCVYSASKAAAALNGSSGNCEYFANTSERKPDNII